MKPDDLYGTLFAESVKGDQDAGGLVNFAYLSGENITKLPEGRPLFVRKPDAKLNLANFIKTQIYSAFAPLKIGMDILLREEHIKTNVLVAQGGIFKTPVVAQQVLADALNTPISVMENAGEGGPWGMAVLASSVSTGITANPWKTIWLTASLRIQPKQPFIRNLPVSKATTNLSTIIRLLCRLKVKLLNQ